MSVDTVSDVGSGGGISDAFYPIAERLFDEEGDFVGEIDRKLAEARMPDTAELYLAKSLAMGVLAGGILWALGVFFGYLLFGTGIIEVGPIMDARIANPTLIAIIEALRVPLLIVGTGLVLGTLGFLGGFGTLVMIPYMNASERERQINMLLPDTVSFMYALSVGGMNQIEILEAVAEAEDTYGEVAAEFQTIVQETTYFDTDYRTAIRNQAFQTPSDDFSQFLTDMLSILNSGGDLTRFLEDKKEKHMRTAKQQQELTLDTLELFGEMYMTLSLFPLLLIIILVIMSMLGEASALMLYVTVYGLIPLLGVGFLVMISTVKQDEPGNGYLRDARTQAGPADPETGLINLGVVDRFGTAYAVFSQIRSRELWLRLVDILTAPHVFFKENPLYTLVVTVPVALFVLVFALMTGSAPTSMDGFTDRVIWSTFVWIYLPLYIVCIPLTIFYEWNVRSRYAIIGNLSDNLRKLSSANDTGQTLLESVETVGETSQGKLADEFSAMRAKVEYGTSLGDALIEFNNKYHIPRLARTVKLIGKAQEASSEITDVLTTAAQASENQDDIDRERRSRTLMQVVIILATYVTLLAVMAILQVQFLEVLAEMTGDAADVEGEQTGGGMDFSAGIEVELLSLMFFHAVTLQAILSGLISGYIRDAKVLSGVKYVVILVTLALGVWIVVE